MTRKPRNFGTKLAVRDQASSTPCPKSIAAVSAVTGPLSHEVRQGLPNPPWGGSVRLCEVSEGEVVRRRGRPGGLELGDVVDEGDLVVAMDERQHGGGVLPRAQHLLLLHRRRGVGELVDDDAAGGAR